MKKYYRVDEVAKELDVSRRTVERAIQRGELDSHKVFGSRRIEAEELERLKGKKNRDDD